MNTSSRSRLHPGLAFHFPGETVHDRVARALCEARCVPRKEFFESWSFVARARRHLDAPVVWDLCAGHGLVGFIFALLERDLVAVRCVDKRRPDSHEKIRRALEPLDPARIAKVSFEERTLERLEPAKERVFVTAVHACGRRTDRAIELAIASRASIAALPCCHDPTPLVERGELPQAVLGRWSKREAVDQARIWKLHHAGYQVLSRRVDDGVTACADLIIGIVPAIASP